MIKAVDESQTTDAAQSGMTDGEGAPIVADTDPDAQRSAQVDPLPDPQAKIFGDVDLTQETAAHGALYVGFDPSIHAQNDDGTPKLKKDGSYAMKRGRKAGGIISALQTEGDLPTPEKIAAPVDTAKKVNYKALGQVYAGLFFGGTSSIIGPEWLPRDNEEKKNVEGAFAVWAESTGASDLPPGITLVMVIASYSAARLQHENTRSKFGNLKNKIVAGVYYLKGRFVK